MKKILSLIFIVGLSILSEFVLATEDIIAQKIAAHKNNLKNCSKNNKRRPNQKKPHGRMPWSSRSKVARESYSNPVGLACPFTPGTELDLYREPGRRMNPERGIFATAIGIKD